MSFNRDFRVDKPQLIQKLLSNFRTSILSIESLPESQCYTGNSNLLQIFQPIIKQNNSKQLNDWLKYNVKIFVTLAFRQTVVQMNGRALKEFAETYLNYSK